MKAMSRWSLPPSMSTSRGAHRRDCMRQSPRPSTRTISERATEASDEKDRRPTMALHRLLVFCGRIDYGEFDDRCFRHRYGADRRCGKLYRLPAERGDTAGMVFILRYGLRAPSRGRALHPHRARRRLLDRSTRGGQLAVSGIRKGHGIRNAGGTCARPCNDPGMPKELVAPGSVVFIPPTNVASGGQTTQ
jgi:hypothetical protein